MVIGVNFSLVLFTLTVDFGVFACGSRDGGEDGMRWDTMKLTFLLLRISNSAPGRGKT